MFDITGFSWKRLIILSGLTLLVSSLSVFIAHSLFSLESGSFTSLLTTLAIDGSFVAAFLLLADREYLRHANILKVVLNKISDVVIVKDKEGNFVFCNDQVAQLYGSHPEDMVGKNDFHFTGNKEQSDFFRESLEIVLRSGKTQEVYETSTQPKTGEIRHFHSLKVPFKDIHNQDQVFIVAKDITNLIELKEEAYKNKRRLEQVLEVSQEGLWEWNAKTDQVLHNRRWELITGVKRSENSFKEFDSCIVAEDRDRVHQALEMLIKHNQPYSIEFRMKRPSDGAVIWVWDRGKVAEYDDKGNPLWLVGIILDITEEKHNQQKVANLAYYDQLTGLANRTHLEEVVEQAIKESKKQDVYNALLFLDLDRFKLLNDSYGHHMGDRLLQSVAERLSHSVAATDTIARFGGDEFVILLTGLKAQCETEAALMAENVANTILRSFQEPFLLGAYEHTCSTSIGISIFSSDSKSLDELLKQADMAMYDAKNAGRNAARFFDPDMQIAAHNRAILEADLRRDVVAEKLDLHYQPQISSEGKITGVEALLRWPHDDRGMISPAEFIPIAESSNLILSIGDWVFMTACKQLAQWADDPILSELVLSVNVSPAQLHSSDFIQSVEQALDLTGAPASKLKLEITESMLVRNMDASIQKMSDLRDRGVSFSLDDFGTGYSSLSYLKQLPLDQLKIDKSFVRDILDNSNDAAIAEMIVALGRTLGLSVIAEGVETEQQRVKLEKLGCHSYQGYLFARPMPLKDLVDFTLAFSGTMLQPQQVQQAVA